MPNLPTCWYCPECRGLFDENPAMHEGGIHGDINSYSSCSGVPERQFRIPPGTPLSVILDATGHPYRRGGMKDFGDGTFEVDEIESNSRVPVLVVLHHATDEAPS